MSEIARHWIDGEWPESGAVSKSVNPATGAVLGQWADGGEAEARAGNRGRPPRVRHLALQFIEDSYATAASFRESGSWTVQTQAGAKPFEV
jgi:hypothetical protein